MSKPFKVFGIGLNRTGTSSLRQALRRLGYRHTGFSAKLVRAWARGEMEPLHRVADFYESFEDWPWPLVWREMEARHGARARFVLTLRRSPGIWLASLKRHAARTATAGHVRRLVYGHASPEGHEAELLAFYERHEREVRAHFAAPERAGRLAVLCWERGDGWAELCGFLGERVPDLPFPHANASPPEPAEAPPPAPRRGLLARLRGRG